MSDVYIAGIDMIKFGKFPDRSVEALGAEAALGATSTRTGTATVAPGAPMLSSRNKSHSSGRNVTGTQATIGSASGALMVTHSSHTAPAASAGAVHTGSGLVASSKLPPQSSDHR